MGWPPLVLAYAYFLAIFDGIWGDPWYEFDWLTDLKGTVFYMIGAPFAFAICILWCLIIAVMALSDLAVWSRRRLHIPACIVVFGAPIVFMAMLLLKQVMNGFFSEAFRY